jgi:hypothetical protein
MKLTASITVLLVAVLASPAFPQESSREDFKEYCKLMQGRWVGDVTWVADWEGFGKRGEKVTAYSESSIAEDGNALIGRFFGGNGSGTGLVFYDAGAKQIKSVWVSSGGGTGQSIIFKKDGKWIERGSGSEPNGAKNEFTSTLSITDNGNTHTWTGSGTLDGKKVDDQHDVWRRGSK